eukprot:6876402-Pyramimonas_sp.AAC.1
MSQTTKFQRHDSKVRSCFLCGVEGVTCDAHALLMMHAEESIVVERGPRRTGQNIREPDLDKHARCC